MRGFLCLGVVLVLAGCGSAEVTATTAGDTGGAASCAGLTPARQLAAARRAFVGVMLPGPTTSLAGRRVLASPARVRVTRWIKGRGPGIVTVRTAASVNGRGVTVAEDGIAPVDGETWKIYASSARRPFETSVCLGSARVPGLPGGGVPPPIPSGRAALTRWRAFPVAANPRPIVPVGERVVLDPRSGFRTVDAKLAYLQGRFVLRVPLPVWLVTFGRFHPTSAAAAYHRLRAAAVNEHEKVPPLIITAVKPGSATFMTDRGPMQLPAWQFYFRGVAEPASVLALAAPDVFIAPPLHRFGLPGPGSSIEASAKLSASGKVITISFTGAQAGSGACDAAYRASAVSDRPAVAYTIARALTPAQGAPSQICTAVGDQRIVLIHLARPLGARVLVSATDGGAVAVTGP